MPHIDLIRNAIIATDNYLGLEEKIQAGDNSDKTAQEFTENVIKARENLNTLGELDKHDYIEGHVKNVYDLTVARDADHMDDKWSTVPSFKDFIKPPQPTAEDESTLEINVQKDIENLEWHDIIDQYADHELVVDDDEDLHEGLEEDISAMSRMRKRLVFARTEMKRDLARKIKLARQSSSLVLKQRSINTARKLLYTRLLRGRDKSKLSVTEKNRIEGVVHKMEKQGILSRIAIRVMPHIRSIERQRLAGRA